MADTVGIILVAIITYILFGVAFAWFVKLLRVEGEIRSRKTEARWLLLCVVWPLIPPIVTFWVVGGIACGIWESLLNLIHDAQLGKRN